MQRCSFDAGTVDARYACAKINDARRLISEAINRSCDIGDIVSGQRKRCMARSISDADIALEKLVLVDRLRQRYLKRKPRQLWIWHCGVRQMRNDRSVCKQHESGWQFMWIEPDTMHAAVIEQHIEQAARPHRPLTQRTVQR